MRRQQRRVKRFFVCISLEFGCVAFKCFARSVPFKAYAATD